MSLYPYYVHYLKPVCVPTSQMRVEIQMKRGHLPWAKKEQTRKDIDLPSFSMIIKPPRSMILRFRVSCDHRSVHSYLTEKRRGYCCWKVPLLSGITIVCKGYRSYLCNCPPQPVDDILTGGLCEHSDLFVEHGVNLLREHGTPVYGAWGTSS